MREETTELAGDTVLDSRFRQEVAEHVAAGYQALYVQSSEEVRVEEELSAVAKQVGAQLITWDAISGFTGLDVQGEESRIGPAEAAMPHKALALLDPDAGDDTELFGPRALIVMRDLDDFFADFRVRRWLQTLTLRQKLNNTRRNWVLILISAKCSLPEKLRPCFSLIEFSLPTEEQMHKYVEQLVPAVQRLRERNAERLQDDDSSAELDPDLHRELTSNLLGLTALEAENCLARVLVRYKGWTPDMLSTVKDEKAAIIRKQEVLTYIPEDSVQSREHVGGYEAYLEWLDRRKLAYTEKARQYNIDFPRGCILIGPPGTGKSMVAKMTCVVLGKPGYILDIGSLFGSLVGESEQRTRDVLRQLDANPGCVLVLDEADKALGNAVNSSGDSGVTRRVFGTILTWLAENQSRTFCIMTLNRTTGLPPELLRAGRFDAMFYTALPSAEERRNILDIHLRLRGEDPTALELADGDWEHLIRKTKDFSGAELEEVVREARYLALSQQGTGTPTFEQLTTAAASVTPMAKYDADGLKEIMSFCEGRARPVAKTHRAKRKSSGRRLDCN